MSHEHGSALMLMPAGVLIVLVLGAMAVDSAIMFLGERELADLAAAAANDAATVGLREEVFYRCGRLEVDDDRARAVAGTVAGARSSDAVTVTGLSVATDNRISPPEVTVTAAGTVRLIFSPALPGQGRNRNVQARSIAVAQGLGPGDPVPRC